MPEGSPPTRSTAEAGYVTDRSWGAFTATGPWDLGDGDVSWLKLTDTLRADTRAEVPRLTRAGRVPPGRRVATVTAQLGAAVAPWAAQRATHRLNQHARADLSRRLRRAFERLGPAYIKLGQIVSSGEGLFPSELVEEFKRCRDQVPAEPFSTVQATIEAEFGRHMLDIFEFVHPNPLAAASIAQVHVARLRTGEDVVVKVQRAGIDRLVRRDIETMAWLAPALVGRIPVTGLANPPALVELFCETILEELDFRLEAANMLDIARVIRRLDRDGYIVPRPHPTLVTRRVLVMQRLKGFNFDDVEGMRDAGIDTEEVIRTGMVAFMEGAMLHGIFHGDLHGGNLFVLDDGTTALLDFGIVARFSDRRRLAFLRLMVGAITNDLRGQVASLRDLGALPADTDIDAVISDLGLDRPPIDPASITPSEMVTEVQRVTKALLNYGARLPKPLMLYVKNLVFLDGAIARLAPDLDLIAEAQRISLEFATRHGATIGAELGLDPDLVEFDFDGMRAGLGVEDEGGITYRELRERRELIQRRMRHPR